MPGSTFLTGEHVSLRVVEETDLPFLTDLANDPAVRRTMYEYAPRTLAATHEWWESLDDDEVHLLIVPSGADAPVGTVGLTGIDAKSGLGCIGYAVAPESWGEGYVTAAVDRLVAYGFGERRLAKLWASTYGTNPASARVLEKAGFDHEAVHPEEAFVEGERVDVWYFGLLADAWRSRSATATG